MPELPDIEAYLTALRPRLMGARLERVRIASPFLLRTVAPPVADLEGREVAAVTRVGKRIVIGVEGDLFLVIHLMIAGRLHWRAVNARTGGRQNLAALDFTSGTLVLTEAGAKRRASLHVVKGQEELQALDPGGIDVLTATREEFERALGRENHTLKRALTDPRVIDGVGNAYSDEILHAAQLSPLALTQKLSGAEWDRLYSGARSTLTLWAERLGREAEQKFPEKVTAFRPEMAVHGRYRQPCPRCGAPVQRIRYADNETNYCAACQTGGKVLADRGLSRLLGADWPRTLDELEALRRR
jgi:formamidopyrimidine-DNA glycosylase